MFRFSLLALLLFTAFVGLGCAALAYATPLVANITLFLVVVILSAALVSALYAARPLRVFAGGFAVCGWVYFATTQQVFNYSDLRVQIVTDDALRILYKNTHGSLRNGERQGLFSGDIEELMSESELWRNYSFDSGGFSGLDKLDVIAFATIGHALWALLLGLFGGGLALLLARRREAKSVATPPRK